jgi:hypothetical protein
LERGCEQPHCERIKRDVWLIECFQAAELRRLKREAQIEGEAFLYKVVNGNSVVGPVKEWKTFFQDISEEEVRRTIHS